MKEAFLLYLIASIYDTVMTLQGLWRGKYEEWNPLANIFIDQFGIIGILYYKILLVSIIILVARYIIREPRYRPLISKIMILGSVITIACATTWLL